MPGRAGGCSCTPEPMSKERIYLFHTTLRGPSARSREASEDGQTGKTVASYGGAA